MTFKATYPGAAFNADGRHVGPGPWLDVIRKANGIAEDEGIEGGIFGAPRYEDDDHAVEIYDEATVSHDFPLREPPFPDGLDFGTHEWERIAREREKVRAEWLCDPRNTVTITSKNALGERLLTAAHEAVAAAA